MSTSNRCMVLIDGANLHMSMQLVGKQIDFIKLKSWLSNRYSYFSLNYYTAIRTDTDGYSSLQSLMDWLKFNGIRVVQKDARTLIRDGKEVTKGNMDIEIAVDAMSSLAANYQDYMFFTGDGDFAYLLKAMRAQGKRVIVVSSMNVEEKDARHKHHYSMKANVISELLRQEIDEFVNLNDTESAAADWYKSDRH